VPLNYPNKVHHEAIYAKEQSFLSLTCLPVRVVLPVIACSSLRRLSGGSQTSVSERLFTLRLSARQDAEISN
jgi:hypothetical protein